MGLRKVLVAALLAMGVATPGVAAVISAVGASEVAGPPGLITNGAPGSNTEYLYINEMQGVTLGANLTTDQGMILSGTRVDSHMVFLNRNGGTALLDIDATFIFSGTILGTMSDTNGGLRMVPSDFLGGAYTYTNFGNRGLETSGQYADVFSGVGTNTLFAQFNVTQPGDWMRVVTLAPVPLPAGALLLLTGLGAFGLKSRRKPA